MICARKCSLPLIRPRLFFDPQPGLLTTLITQPMSETFEKCKFLFEIKKGENFNRRNTLSISRIELKLHFVQNVEPDAEIGQKGAFCKGLWASGL